MAADFNDIMQNFSASLEALVEELKEQNKKDPTELLNQIVTNLDGDTLKTIVKDISVIKENVQNINKNTDKILEVVKEQKKAKEVGMMGDVEDSSNKDKIIGAIKTVVLIAAGVLAIGLAFQIVGDVDFLSVISLGLGIMFVAYAFAKVASIKDEDGKPIDLKSAMQTSLIMIIMSGALLISGFIINMMPTIGLMKLLTVIGIGAGLGVATYLIMKGMRNIKMKDIPKLMLAPIILPMISLAIVMSSYILAGVIDVPLWTVIKTSLAIGLSTLMMLPTIYMLNKMNLLKPTAIKDLVTGIGSIALISTAIMISSWILSAGNYDGSFPTTEWSLGVGIALISFAIPMIAIGLIITASGGAGIVGLALGLIALPIIATGIVITSYILQAGSYDNPVPLEWAIGTGLLMITFGATMIVLGVLSPLIALGMLSMILVATSIVLTSYILQAGSYEKYPEYDWSLSIGLLMITYAVPMATLGLLLPLIIIGMLSMYLVAKSIVSTSEILSKGSYDIYPSYEWSLGSGLAMFAFGESMILLGAISLIGFGAGFLAIVAGGFAVLVVAETIARASHILGGGDYSEGNYPGEDWAKGVGGSIMAFANALEIQSGMKMMSFFGGDADLSTFIKKISNAILVAGDIFTGSKGYWEEGNYPGEDWAKGVGGSITAFANALKIQTDSGGWFSDDINMVDFISDITKAIVDSGKYFTENGKGMWGSDTYPTINWINSISETINKISSMNIDIDIFEDFVQISEYLLDAAKYFARIQEYPMGDGVKEFSNSIAQLIEVLPDNDSVDPFLKLVDGFKDLADISWLDLLTISEVSSLIEDLVESLDDLSENKVESLLKMGAGFQLISLIDQKQLEEVLEVMDEKSDSIKNIIDEDSFVHSFLDDIFSAKKESSNLNQNQEKGAIVDEFSPFEKKLIEHVEKIDKNIEILSTSKTAHNEAEEELMSANLEDDSWFGGKKIK